MAYQPLAVQQLPSMLERDNAVLLDSRDAHSFLRARIPGARPADDRTIRSLIRARAQDYPVTVYCYHGNSSCDFCTLLSAIGFTRPYNIEGGRHTWYRAQTGLVAAGADLSRQTLNGLTALGTASTRAVLRFLKPHFAAPQPACT